MIMEYGKSHVKYNQLMICDLNPKIPVVQDTPHVCNKVKNRLMEINNFLALGVYMGCIGHLKLLVQNVPKALHGLNMEDIDSEDRMNFDSLRKICTDNIFNLLKTHIALSEGTIEVLRLIKSLFVAYIDEDVDSRTRLFNAWFAIFFSRFWKNWLKSERKSMDHFITDNAYTGIELNGHFLLTCFSTESYSNVNISKCNSQMTEYVFRTFRSMTSTFDTRINFSVMDVVSRLNKLHANQKIISALREKLTFRKNLTKEKSRSTINEK